MNREPKLARPLPLVVNGSGRPVLKISPEIKVKEVVLLFHNDHELPANKSADKVWGFQPLVPFFHSLLALAGLYSEASVGRFLHHIEPSVARAILKG